MFRKRTTIMLDFIGVLTSMAFVLCLCTAECPTRSDTMDLDLDKFSGEWFVVSATPPNGKSLSKCGRFTVTPTSSDTFGMNYMAVETRQNNFVTFTVTAKLDDDVTGNWQRQGSNTILGPYKHRVIDVNYNSHFVMIVCGGTGGNLRVREFAMICAREKTLSPIILDELKDKAGSYIDRAKILDVDRSGC